MSRHSKLPGGVLLEHVETVDGVLVYKKRFAHGRHYAGDPVAVAQNSKGKPAYRIQSTLYRADHLISAIENQDPEWIDNPFTKQTASRKSRSILTPRDMDIYDALKLGTVYADVGATYGVSRQRIKQIVDKLANHGFSVSARAERRESRATAEAKAKVSKYGNYHAEIEGSPELMVKLSARITAKRNHAKQRGIEFDLTVSDLYPLPEVCPALGIPLSYDNGRGDTDNSMSIDRIDPSGGYTRGNIVLVSQRANRIKNNASVDELMKIAAFYADLEIKSI